jgi:iron(III) transport system substrate-binding protein
MNGRGWPPSAPRQRHTAGAWWVVALVLAAACAPPARPSAAPAPPGGATAAPLQALIDGARQEGQLSFVWGEGTLGGSEGVGRLAAGFNREYGLNLSVRFTPGPSMNSMGVKAVEEYQARRVASSDIVVGYANILAPIIEAGALEPVEWMRWAPNIQDPRLVAPGGVAVTYQSSVRGITYNTNRLTEATLPRSLADLLKPQYRGRIASTPYAAGFDRLAIPELWGEQRTLEYVARLADQVAGLIRCNETERVISGEFDLLAIDCSQTNALAMRAKGAPVDFALAADAPLAALVYMGVPKGAAHPNAAKLWVNYILSREAQDVLYELTFSDSHLLPGGRTAADIERFGLGSGQFVLEDAEFYQRHGEQELARVAQEAQRLLQKQ